MVREAYCPYCKEDYNTIDYAKGMIKCMNCYAEYPIKEWENTERSMCEERQKEKQ